MQPTAPSQAAPQGGLDPGAVNLAKAIRQTESGGDFQAQGKSGEFGAYQFTAPTWQAASQKYLGQSVPLNQATPEQQNQVAYSRVKEWKDAGYNVGQIASMWNAGESEPNAYTGSFSNGNPSTGTNKFGAKYDVGAYAKSVATAYQTLKQGGQVGADPNNPSSTANPQSQPSFMDNLIGGAKAVGNFVAPIVGDVYNDISGQNNKTGLQQLGDLGQTALTAASFIPGVGEGALAAKLGIGAERVVGEGLGAAGTAGIMGTATKTVPNALSRLTTNAAIGAGFGVTGALGAGQTDPGQIGKSALAGTLLGGGLGAVGEGASALLNKAPNSILEDTLPFKQGASESAGRFANRVDSTVNTIKDYNSSTVGGMTKEGTGIIKDLNSQIDSKIAAYRNDPAAIITGNDLMAGISREYPDASSLYTPEYVQNKLTQLAPDRADLVQKLFQDGLTPTAANTLKKELYQKSQIARVLSFRTGAPSDLAEMGATASLNLAGLIKGKVPGTSQLFAQEAKHIGAMKVLGTLSKQSASKFVSKGDVAATLGGFALGGPLGAGAAELGQRVLQHPDVRIAGSKLLSRLGQSQNLQRAGTAAKVASLRAMLGASGNQPNQGQPILPTQ